MLDIAIKDKKTPNDLKDDCLIPAYQSGKLLQSLINDILDYSLFLAGKLHIKTKTKSLMNSLEKVRYLVESQAKKKNLVFNIKISQKITDKLRTDHKRLRQILINLLSNALKFTIRGSITLSVDAWGLDNRILKFSVADTGTGMTDQDLERINQVLKKSTFTEKLTQSGAGIGMGLMMSQILIKKLAPRITKLSGIKLESRSGEGSTFWFFIDSKQDTPVQSPQGSIHLDMRDTISMHQDNLNAGNDIRINFSPSQGISDQKDDDCQSQSLNTESQTSQVKFLEPRRVISRMATLEMKKKYSSSQDNHITNGSDREDTLNDNEQHEDEIACMIKDNNINLNIKGSDLFQRESHRFLHPKLIGSAQKFTELSAILTGSEITQTASNRAAATCDCPKILVADDDVFNLFTMQSLMKSLGLTISQAHNGQEAIDVVLKRVKSKCSVNCKPFKLVLMDLSMPVMDGFEATLKLKEMMTSKQIPFIPIVACTAFVDTDKAEKCYQCGMEGRISKPVSKNKIKEVLKNYGITFNLDE